MKASIIIALLSCACAGLSANEVAAVGVDTVDQTDCVIAPEAGIGKAAMRADIDACRDRVKAARDGGAS